MEWQESYDRIKPYLIRIDSEDGFGTGFLLAYNQDHSVAAIATAAHVVDHANNWRKPLKLGHYDTKEFSFYDDQNRVIWSDTVKDGATILVRSTSLTLPSNTLPLMDATKYKRIGVEVGWVGFPAIVPYELCFFSGKISSFLEREDCYLIDGVAINGVSGGPVFGQLHDSTPEEIIGIVSAYMPSRRIGESLPGLVRAQDVTPFHEHIQRIRSFDEAKEKEQETQKEITGKDKDQNSEQIAGEGRS